MRSTIPELRAVSATRAAWFAAGRARAGAIALDRRGARLGSVRELGEIECGDDELESRWNSDRPIVLRGALSNGLAKQGAAMARTIALFDRIREGATLADDLWRRVREVRRRSRNSTAPATYFEPAGVTIDLGDAREIEKVFAHRRRGARRIALDLYAKLSWISVDERDESLRIRFSFGAEALMEWIEDASRSVHADEFARAVFPECELIDGNRALLRLLERLNGRRVRLSERIVYNNAPGGGAIFHHDAEPWQLGVVYGQFVGETAWFALPKRELAEFVPQFARGSRARKSFGTRKRALRALDQEDAADLARVLNETPALARALVERGAYFRLRPGDAILMPSHGIDDVCWHSVFALGRTPSLSHSYGIFSARRRASDPLAITRASSPGGETRMST